MAQLSHAKPGVSVVTGSFTGASTPVIQAGNGTFTVSYAASLYTVTILGPEPVATKMVISLTVEDPALTGATDEFIVNVKDNTPGTGVFTIQARDVAGTAGKAQDACIIHFVAYLHVATDSVA